MGCIISMVLSKPLDEECGNCRFCISKNLKITKTEGSGLFSSGKKVEENIESFWCRRSAPSYNFKGSMDWNSTNLWFHTDLVYGASVPKDFWCGEWKNRV